MMMKMYDVLFLLTCLFDIGIGIPLVPVETFDSVNSAELKNESRDALFFPFMHRKLEHERSPNLFLGKSDNNVDNNTILSYCRRPANCQPLNGSISATCLGTKLPYSKTTLDLVPGLSSLEEVQEQLQIWRGLSDLPKCWAVIQPFLCSVYMPKCDDKMVYLPSQEVCKMVMNSCRILAVEERGWPAFLKCDNQTEFPRGCKNDVQLKFNNTGRCKEPMVQTDNPVSYYDGVEGCGVQCDNPLFTLDERNQIHRLVAWAATACLLFNLFTVVTFIIDWKSASKYPALVIFYINFCFLIVCIGWLAQFLPGGREDIVCRKDGTLRVGEPSAGENLSCVLVFVLTYYFLMAGIVWFVILTYAWHISFQALGKIQERMDKKGAYFHLVAWSLPLVLTITTMALGEIDGNSVSGICFVGSVNHLYRAIFLLLPVFAALTVGGFFLFKGLLTLIQLKINSQEIISERASAKIRETILRMGFFSVLIFIFGLTIFVCHIHEFRNSASWSYSFRKFIVCRLGVTGTEPSSCRMESRPSLAILQLHLLSLFATGITMSSWVWTNSTVHTWKRFFRRVTNNEVDEPVKLKKHKVIAQVFAKRKILNSDGRLSISMHNTYQDPVGLNFELNSLASGELSSTWAAALPKLITRRGALVGITNSSSSQRRNSMDSEISYSVRSLDFRVSVESRRHSLDSAVSVQLSEITRTVRQGSRRPTSRGRNKRRRRETKQRSSQLISRRNSSTSQESQLGAQILSALSIGAADLPPISSVVPNLNLKRRPGNAGLDDQLNILAGKLFGTLTNSHGIKLPSDSTDCSEDEENNKEANNDKICESSNENNSNGKNNEKSADEESDDATLPLTGSYKNKIKLDGRTSKTSDKSKRKSVADEDGRSKKLYTDDRNSKSSNKSDKSRTSRASRASRNKDHRKDRESKRERKNDGKVYQSCSDMENCTDDLKWIHSEGEGKSLSGKVSVGIATDSSFSPELIPLTYQSSSGVSLGGNPNLGREIGTQTSVSFNNNEHPLDSSYGVASP